MVGFMNSAVVAQLRDRMIPLRIAADAPFDPLEPLAARVRDATVVALGSAARQSRELSTLSAWIMRFLIERHGFRALVLEGDETASLHLDIYVLTGAGDPRAILASARPFWRFEEILAAVCWIRARNERNPGDPVRVVHPQVAIPRADGGGDLERSAANATIQWHARTGSRIVYWGGLAHTATSLTTGMNLGSHLQERFGRQYMSIALTFHHGLTQPLRVDEPPADHVEAVLGAVHQEAYLLPIQGGHPWPEPARGWLEAPAKMRVIGPGRHTLLGVSLLKGFDSVLHSRRVTPASALHSTASRPEEGLSEG